MMTTFRRILTASSAAALCALLWTMPTAAAQSAPKGATAHCKDGTYSTAKTKQGACSRHGGVQTWLADEKTPTATTPATPKAPASTAAANEPPKSTGPKTTAKATAKASGEAPANATAKCKDNTYSFAKQHSGACSHHGGVAEWYK